LTASRLVLAVVLTLVVVSALTVELDGKPNKDKHHKKRDKKLVKPTIIGPASLSHHKRVVIVPKCDLRAYPSAEAHSRRCSRAPVSPLPSAGLGGAAAAVRRPVVPAVHPRPARPHVVAAPKRPVIVAPPKRLVVAPKRPVVVAPKHHVVAPKHVIGPKHIVAGPKRVIAPIKHVVAPKRVVAPIKHVVAPKRVIAPIRPKHHVIAAPKHIVAAAPKRVVAPKANPSQCLSAFDGRKLSSAARFSFGLCNRMHDHQRPQAADGWWLVQSALKHAKYDCLFDALHVNSVAQALPIMRARGGYHAKRAAKVGDIAIWAKHAAVVVDATAGGVELVHVGLRGACMRAIGRLDTIARRSWGSFLGFWTPRM